MNTNYKSWYRALYSFIEFKHLERDLQDFCGGWPPPKPEAVPVDPPADNQVETAKPKTNSA